MKVPPVEQQDEQQIQCEVDAQQEVVVLKTRGRFDISERVTVLPFAMLDMLYMNRLAAGLQKAGVIRQKLA